MAHRDLDEWQSPTAEEAPRAGEALVVDVAGFEGPLDLLLALARLQRVDLAHLSIAALVDQYLEFIANTAELRIEVAADYLVMAAWLALLKSRLLLPREAKPVDEINAEDAARALTFRLMRLDAMQQAAARLLTRQRLGRDVFARGFVEPPTAVTDRRYSAQIYDLLRAYADQRRRTITVGHVVKARRVWSIKDARARLEVMLGEGLGSWVQLDLFLDRFMPVITAEAPVQPDPRTLIASSFGATLEMARDGLIDLQQDGAFAPIHVRRRTVSAGAEPPVEL